MRKRIFVLGALVLFISIAQAHEFWMHTVKFFLQPGESTDVQFVVGENFIGEQWDLKVHRLDILHAADSKNLLDSIKVEGRANLSIALQEEGTHMVVLESNSAFIELDGEKFNEYLKEDGLDDVLSSRKKSGSLDKPGKEFYKRYSKLLLQVGKKRDDTYKTVIGTPIEIVPETNPYTYKKGDLVRFRILADGKPAFGVKVRVWNRFQNRTTIQPVYPEKDGIIETRIVNPGPWMVSVVKMVPSKQPGADWQSYWASLTFGVK